MKQLLIFILVVTVFETAFGKECEVCESVINKLRANLPNDATPEEIEIEFKRWCKTAVGKEEKFVSIILTKKILKPHN